MIMSYGTSKEFVKELQRGYYFYPRDMDISYYYMQNHGPKFIGKPSSDDMIYEDILIDVSDAILSEDVIDDDQV